jgi:hypothetical protein
MTRSSSLGLSATLVLACFALAARGFSSPSRAPLHASAMRQAASAAATAAAAPAAAVLRSNDNGRASLPRMDVEAASDSAAKITIRKPGESGGASSGTKVSVRVRSPGEKKAAAAAASPDAAAAANDDSTMSVSVKVKEPVVKAKPPPPPGLETQNLSDAEKMLLEGTQRANCTMMIEALNAGANPNVRDPKGRTPLHFVAGLGLAPAAVILIHFGAQVDIRDGDNLTPMHMASGYANAQTLRVLVAAGAEHQVVGNNQGTPTEVVIALGDYQLSQWFNRTGADKLKKKDDKLEKLKACLDVLDNIEEVRNEEKWEDIVEEVMKCIAPPELEEEAGTD